MTCRVQQMLLEAIGTGRENSCRVGRGCSYFSAPRGREGAQLQGGEGVQLLQRTK